MDKFITRLPLGPTSKKSVLSCQSSSSNSSSGKRSLDFNNTSVEKVSKKGKAPKLTQMYLDLGQKSFGATKQCSICDMFYVIGDVDDEKRHKSFCGKSQQDHLFQSDLNDSRIVKTYDDEFDGVEAHVIHIRCTEQIKLKKEWIQNLLQFVQVQLGSTLDLLTDNKSGESLMLFVKEKRVLGLIVVEPIEPSILVSLERGQTTADLNVPILDNNGSENVNNSIAEEKQEMAEKETTESGGKKNLCQRPLSSTLGVKLIWVSKNHRRGQIATRLLDCCRGYYEYGRIVRKEHLAYSQPTDNGQELALAYTKRDNIWVYH